MEKRSSCITILGKKKVFHISQYLENLQKKCSHMIPQYLERLFKCGKLLILKNIARTYGILFQTKEDDDSSTGSGYVTVSLHAVRSNSPCNKQRFFKL